MYYTHTSYVYNDPYTVNTYAWQVRWVVFVRWKCRTVQSAVVREKEGEKEAGPEGHHLFRVGAEGDLRRDCPKANEKSKNDRPKEENRRRARLDSKTEPSDTKKPSSGALYTAFVNSSVLAGDTLSESFHVESGASTHLVPSKSDLRSYVEFDRPLEIAAAKSGNI